jgi:hypothetical protein
VKIIPHFHYEPEEDWNITPSILFAAPQFGQKWSGVGIGIGFLCFKFSVSLVWQNSENLGAAANVQPTAKAQNAANKDC